MELLTVTRPELDRARVLQQVLDGSRRQRQAAQELGLCVRQVRRLLRELETCGSAAVPSKRRGKPPNNRISNAIRALILERYRSTYQGFGPTFLAETLAGRDEIFVSREWLRALLLENDLWKAKRRKRNVHPLRERRPRFGELVQMDGSPHDWFEERGPRCTLLVAIDDATSRTTAARFETSETTDGYYGIVSMHLKRYGRFRAAYADKHSIFRYSGTSADLETTTQMQRSLDELDIELICANSPQAKGRVERVNRTFQDRLIKAMRLEGISNIDAANAFLPQFIDDHNKRCAIEPAVSDNAHRSIEGFDLDQILCRREERVVTKNLMFQINDGCFALVDPYSRRNLATGSRIALHLHRDRPMTVHHGDHELVAEPRGRLTRTVPIVGSKDLNAHLNRRLPDPKKVRTPAANHPWRTYQNRPRPPKADISALQKADI